MPPRMVTGQYTKNSSTKVMRIIDFNSPNKIENYVPIQINSVCLETRRYFEATCSQNA
jgi:hypothetical protein